LEFFKFMSSLWAYKPESPFNSCFGTGEFVFGIVSYVEKVRNKKSKGEDVTTNPVRPP